MVRFDDDGKIIEFEVMIRPLEAIELMHRLMGEQLEQLGGTEATPG